MANYKDSLKRAKNKLDNEKNVSIRNISRNSYAIILGKKYKKSPLKVMEDLKK